LMCCLLTILKASVFVFEVIVFRNVGSNCTSRFVLDQLATINYACGVLVLCMDRWRGRGGIVARSQARDGLGIVFKFDSLTAHLTCVNNVGGCFEKMNRNPQ
jgi:hypothetical protein